MQTAQPERNKMLYAALTMLLILLFIGLFGYFFGGPTATRLYEQGKTAAGKGDMEQAIEHFTSAISTEHTDNELLAQILNARGEVYTRIGRPDKAKIDFKQALSHTPENTDVLHNMGLLYAGGTLGNADYLQALQYLNKACAIAGNTRRDILASRARVEQMMNSAAVSKAQ